MDKDFEKMALIKRLQSKLLVEKMQFEDLKESAKTASKDDTIECYEYIMQCVFEVLENEGVSISS